MSGVLNVGALSFDPLAPLGVIVLCAILAFILTLILARRSAIAGLLRFVAFGGFVGLLMNPQVETAEQTPLRDVVVILTDATGSQGLDGRSEITNATAAALKDKLEATNSVDVVEAEIVGNERSDIAASIVNAIGTTSRAQLASVFLITDGQSSDKIDPALLSDETPIHVILTGRADEADRKITLLDAPRYGLVNESIDVRFRIDDVGFENVPLGEGTQAMVTLRVDGDQIVQQAVPIGSEIEFAAPLERPGKLIIEIEAATRDGELSTRNNTAVLDVSAIRDRLRVLLISGEPHAGERAWRNLLKSDPAIDLVHFTILRPIEKAQSDNAFERELALIEFPQDELFIEKLKEFDLVIFDRYTYRGVLNAYHFDNIARYVDAGGAVLVSSGPEFFGPLSLAARRNFSFILPVLPNSAAIEETYRPAISDEGKRHPVTRGLPETDIWGRWLRIMPVVKRSGRTLMTGPSERALLVLDRVGEGRVGVLLSDHVWLWARGFDGGGPHAELLRRISHWLMKEPDLEEEQLKLIAEGTDLVIERLTVEETTSNVRLTGPSGVEENVTLSPSEPGIFSTRLTNVDRGLYRARSGELFAVGAVGLAAPPEFQDVVSISSALKPAAEKAGGGVFMARDGTPSIRVLDERASRRASDNWAGIVTRNAARIDQLRSSPLLPPLVWLLLTGLSLLGAWWLEGRHRRASSDQ